MIESFVKQKNKTKETVICNDQVLLAEGSKFTIAMFETCNLT